MGVKNFISKRFGFCKVKNRRRYHSANQESIVDNTGNENASLNEAALQVIRQQMAVSLERTKNLEEQVKMIPILQVQLSVLKEEKRKLLTQIGDLSKRERTNGTQRLETEFCLNNSTFLGKKEVGTLCTVLKRDVGVSCQSIRTRDTGVITTSTIQPFEGNENRNFEENRRKSHNLNVSFLKSEILKEINRERRRRLRTSGINIEIIPSDPEIKKFNVNPSSFVDSEMKVQLENTLELRNMKEFQEVKRKKLRRSKIESEEILSDSKICENSRINESAYFKVDSSSFNASEQKLGLNFSLESKILKEFRDRRQKVLRKSQITIEEIPPDAQVNRFGNLEVNSSTFNISDQTLTVEDFSKFQVLQEIKNSRLNKLRRSTTKIEEIPETNKFLDFGAINPSERKVELGKSVSVQTSDSITSCSRFTSTEGLFKSSTKYTNTNDLIKFSTKYTDTLNLIPKKRHFGTSPMRKKLVDVSVGDSVKSHIIISCTKNYCDSCKETIKSLFEKISEDLKNNFEDRKSVSTRSVSGRKLERRLEEETEEKSVQTELGMHGFTLKAENELQSQQIGIEENLNLMSGNRCHPLEEIEEENLKICHDEKCSKAVSSSPKHRNLQINIKTSDLMPEEKLKKEFEPSREIQRKETQNLIEIEKWRRKCELLNQIKEDLGSQGKTSSSSKHQNIETDVENNFSTQINENLASQPTILDSSEHESQQVQSERTSVCHKKRIFRKKMELSNQIERNLTSQEIKPPSSEQIQSEETLTSLEKIKSIQEFQLPKEIKAAMKVLNDNLVRSPQKNISKDIKNALKLVEQFWFQFSTHIDADPVKLNSCITSISSFSDTLLNFIINLNDSSGNTALHYSVSNANFEVISVLLESRVCRVDEVNFAGYSAIMLAALVELKNEEEEKIMKKLLAVADVNAKAKMHGQTALMLAVSHGNKSMTRLLIEAGASLNIQDEDGSTALMCAAEHGNIELVRSLLSQSDCDTSIIDLDGNSALKVALEAENHEIAVLLYAHEKFNREFNSESSSIRRSRKESKCNLESKSVQ
ncbi:uncharacterized protein LOC105698392 isoform X2 [Orussus abietinus]|uniref:uncharacterized protein LOC105698392 isoform X2 n=1 Tax=Orussus abietinus TaxID=222816 RepID=UPI000625B31D|nr:uncharacterized protein LOC105698392 isoform X2 [Orussus abietinus]